MKILKITILIIVTFVCTFLLLYLVVISPFINESKILQQRNVRLLCHTDYNDLLDACREYLRQAEKGELKKYYNLYSDPNKETSKLPKVILDLEPNWIDIDQDRRIMINLGTSYYHFGVYFYPDNYKLKKYGNRELTSGLWYYSDSYSNNPDYDKKIDEIIKKGK